MGGDPFERGADAASVRKSLGVKIAARPGFSEDCALAFYEDLFDVVPGSKAMFSSIDAQIRMLSMVIELISSTTKEQELMELRLRQLGRKHAEMGVTSLHMKVARSSLLKAAVTACPELDELELDYFGSCYLKIISAMNERGPVPVEDPKVVPLTLH